MGNGETLPVEHALPIRAFAAVNPCIRSSKSVHSQQ